MPDLEQIPFSDVEFADNPEPRCPCVLLLDTSYSMSGEKIAELNRGLDDFAEDVSTQIPVGRAKRVEVAIVTFGPVQTIQYFVTADEFRAPMLGAEGDTPMGAAIEKAIELIEERKATYKASGIGYYRPWIFLISDGAPTDDVFALPLWRSEREKLQRHSVFYSVGVMEADMGCLARISSERDPLKLRGLCFQ